MILFLVLVVLDTCLVVAAWKSRNGASFALLEALADDAFEIALSVPLVVEYESVLIRHLSNGRKKSDVHDLVDYLCSVAKLQTIFYLWRPLLKDPKDDMVAELAVAAQADAVVTHNISDFGPLNKFAVEVVGTFVTLANGTRRRAMLGNVDLANARATQHFLTLSFESAGVWFHLARYHDVDYDRNGPRALSAFLGLDVDDVFPVRYDLGEFAKEPLASACGLVVAKPTERLSSSELIALAIP